MAINQVLKKIKKGMLLPTGIFKLLFGKKKINQVRVLAIGVIDGYKKLGIVACFYASLIKSAAEKNMAGGEASWVLENNYLMNRGIQSMNGRIYKKYNMKEKVLITGDFRNTVDAGYDVIAEVKKLGKEMLCDFISKRIVFYWAKAHWTGEK